MQARPASKYHLKDLHREIGFYDRKIAYCQKFEKFDSEEERSRAIEKLIKKRKTLVQSATAMASAGVDCDSDQRPRSMKSGLIRRAHDHNPMNAQPGAPSAESST
jgi:hypothetical protein